MSKLQRPVACIGTGVIGSSWAVAFGMGGWSVRLYDVSSAQLESSKQFIEKNLGFLVENHVLTAREAKNALDRMTFTTDLKQAVENTYLIQESAPEAYPVKQKILESVDLWGPADAIFASSTSGLLITEIAGKSGQPQRCIGAHPYNPPHLIPLVEISKGENTDPAIVTRAVDFYRSLGKAPVVLRKDTPGFLGNRLAFALYREAISLVMNGVCSVEDIDKTVAYGIGLRWAILGPIMLYELGGGPKGIKGMQKLDVSLNHIFEDLSTMKQLPEQWYELAAAGLAEEKINLPDAVGHTNEDIARYRDRLLLNLLRLSAAPMPGTEQGASNRKGQVI